MVAIVTMLIVIFVDTKDFIYTDMDTIPVTEAAIVPSAAILKNGDLSPVLRDRVNTALDLYRAHKVAKILVTGNNESLAYNEVAPVRKYLLAKQVPEQDIFLDHAGFDTYSSMYRARTVFHVQSMTIVTQAFHLPRATYIARQLGIDAYGLTADNGTYLLYNYIREIPADIKAVVNLIFNRQPKYLGHVIPITGDGRETLK